MNENPFQIYDMAFELTLCLRNHSNEFLNKDVIQQVTVYPSAWYDNFFEILIRDKYNSEVNHTVDKCKLEELLDKRLRKMSLSGWNYKIKWIPSPTTNDAITPIHIQFSKGG